MLRAEKKWQRHRKPHGHGPERGLLTVLFRYYMFKGFHDGIQVGSGFHSARAVREKKEADAKAQKVVKDAEASSRGKCGGFRASCSHAGLPEGLELRVMLSGGNSRQLSGWQFPPHRSSTRSRARSSRAACFSSLIGFFSEWHPLKDMSPVATRMNNLPARERKHCLRGFQATGSTGFLDATAADFRTGEAKERGGGGRSPRCSQG